MTSSLAVLEAVFDPVVVLEPIWVAGEVVDFRYRYANAAACQCNGRAPEQIVACVLSEVVSPTVFAAVFSEYVKVLDTGVPLRQTAHNHCAASELASQGVDSRCLRVDGNLVVTWRDFTELEQAPREAEESHTRIGTVLRVHIDPHVVLRAVHDDVGDVIDFAIDEANPAALHYLSIPADRISGIGVKALVAGRAGQLDLALLRSVLAAGQPAVLNDDQVLRTVNGSDVVAWVDVRITRLDGEHLLGTWRDVTERHLAHQLHSASLQEQAQSDELTGLPNRRVLQDRVPRALRVAAAAGLRAAALFCDLDDFKSINDRFGHEVGDLVLRAVADRLRMGVRQEDLVVRLSGDELLIVLAGVRDGASAAVIAHELREAIRKPIFAGAIELCVTASFGICVADPSDSMATLLARADAAMYSAKRAGRDCIAIA